MVRVFKEQLSLFKPKKKKNNVTKVCTVKQKESFSPTGADVLTFVWFRKNLLEPSTTALHLVSAASHWPTLLGKIREKIKYKIKSSRPRANFFFFF